MSLEVSASPLWSRAFSKQVDSLTSDSYLIPSMVLMESAGRALFDFIERHETEGRPILILAGAGNNGGDAMVCARYLLDADYECHVFLISADDPPKFTDNTLAQTKILERLAVPLKRYTPGCFKGYDEPIFVDGIFGIGFHGAFAEDHIAFRALKEARGLTDSVLAVDVPSGADADCADLETLPCPANYTLTFGSLKPFHVIAPGRDLCGEVEVAQIGFPNAAVYDTLDEISVEAAYLDGLSLLEIDPWKNLPASAHKYDRGHVLVLGGSPGKAGAAVLTGLAALRSGAGWVTLGLDPQTAQSLPTDTPPEITFEDFYTEGALSPEKLKAFVADRKVKSIVIGPGMSEQPLSQELVAMLRSFIQSDQVFVLLDAGATHGAMALLQQGEIDDESVLSDFMLLTPHPGEWRKMGMTKEPTRLEHLQSLQSLANQMEATLLFKSATPIALTGDPDNPAFVLQEGSPILSRAGSGDVFAGIVGAHGAAGFNALTAAARSYTVMTLAAVEAANALGDNAVLATDIIDLIGMVQKPEEED